MQEALEELVTKMIFQDLFENEEDQKIIQIRSERSQY